MRIEKKCCIKVERHREGEEERREKSHKSRLCFNLLVFYPHQPLLCVCVRCCGGSKLCKSQRIDRWIPLLLITEQEICKRQMKKESCNALLPLSLPLQVLQCMKFHPHSFVWYGAGKSFWEFRRVWLLSARAGRAKKFFCIAFELSKNFSPLITICGVMIMMMMATITMIIMLVCLVSWPSLC